MTEEEFKKTMAKVIGFIVVAIIMLVIIGIIVFNQAGKTKSIFESQAEKDNYKKRVEKTNSHNITEEEVEELENSGEFQENEPSENPEKPADTEEQQPEENTGSEGQ